MADDTGVDQLAVQRTMRAWVVGGSGLPLDSVYWGQQDSKRIPEPAIEMRVYSTHTVGEPWLSTRVGFVSFDPLTVTGAAPADNALVVTAHGFTNGDGPVRVLSTGALPSGVLAGVDYWVILIDGNRVGLATSFLRAGAAFVDAAPSSTPVVPVTITDAGTGTVTIESTSETLRAGREIQYISRAIERVGLMLQCHTSDAVGMDTAMSILSRIKARQRLPSQQRILRLGHLGLMEVMRARAIHGTRNAVMFEPRAMMEVYFSLATEEIESDTIIERGSVTNELTGKVSTFG